jgi:hypothetical protein
MYDLFGFDAVHISGNELPHPTQSARLLRDFMCLLCSDLCPED